MRLLDQIKMRLRTLFHRDQVESDLHREFQFHLQEQITENISRGMSAEEAKYAAVRTVGPVAQIQEQCRDQRGLHWFEITMQDVRFALRSLGKTPAFTLVAVLSLALGTGANMAIFSLIDSIMLNSLSVKDPQNLVFVRTNRIAVGNFMVSHTLANRDLEAMQQATQIDGLTSTQAADRLNITVDGQAELAAGDFVSGSYFEVLGVSAELGRTIVPSDDSITGNAGSGNWPVMISDGYWKSRFGKDTRIIGKPISINTIPCLIVGILPRGFQGLSVDKTSQVMLPATIQKQVLDGSVGAGFPKPEDPSGTQIFARIRPEVSRSKAAAELTVIFHQSELSDNSLTSEQRKSIAAHVIEFESAARGSSMLRLRFSNPLRILMATVALVMLIACANLAGLMLARASARQKEIALRLSLGSSRRRLVRQLLTESLILSAFGSLLGIGFAVIAREATLRIGNVTTAELSVHWDLSLFIFLIAACVLNALFFGLIPALRVTNVDPNEVLKGTHSAQHSTRLPFGRILVTAQLAISLVLTVGAALCLGTLHNLYRVDLGFNPEKLLMATLDPTLAGFNNARTVRAYSQLMEEVQHLPSVQSATLMNNPLFSGRAHLSNARVVGYVPRSGEDLSNSWTITYGVGPGFFTTLQMPMATGRDFTAADKEGAPPVVVINQAMADHYFQGKDPIGQKLSFGSATKTAEIVGVVRDAHYFDVQDEKQSTIFTPLLQVETGEFGAEETLIARTHGDPSRTIDDLRAIVHRVDPNLPLFNVTTMSDRVAGDLSTPRLMATLSTFFGGLALALSAIGLYGALAYGVSRRIGEIGIRMALGADRGSILRLILSETSRIILIGILSGVGLSLAASRLIKSILYGLSAHDARVMIVSAALLAIVALIAAALPARRAVSVDPIVALRYE